MPLFNGTKTKHPKTAQQLCATDNFGSGTTYSRLHCDLRRIYEDRLKLTDSNQPLWRLKASVNMTAAPWTPLTATQIALHMSRTVWQSQWPVLIFLPGFKGVFHVILSHSLYCTSISAGDECPLSHEGFVMSSSSMCILWLKRLWQSWEDYAMRL